MRDRRSITPRIWSGRQESPSTMPSRRLSKRNWPSLMPSPAVPRPRERRHRKQDHHTARLSAAKVERGSFAGSAPTIMGAPPQKHRLSANRRRALELLANSPDGATKETLVLVHWIDRDTIAGLVRTGLASSLAHPARLLLRGCPCVIPSWPLGCSAP